MHEKTNWIWASATMLLAGATLLSGCASSGPATNDTAQAESATTDDQVALEQEPETEFERNLSLIEQSLLQRGDISIEPSLPEPQPTLASGPDRPFDAAESEVAATPSTGAIANAGAAVSVEEQPEADDDGLAIGAGTDQPSAPSAQERMAAQATQLAALVREFGEGNASPVGAMVYLAALEAIAPGLIESQYGPLPSAAASMQLTDDERTLVEAAQRAASSLRDELQGDFVDPQAVAAAIQTLSEQLRPVRTLTLNDVKLCLRVENYGVYRAVQLYDDRYKFLAGREHPVIVYSELDHFTHTPGAENGVPGFTVNVRQALKIYRIGTEDARDTESTLVWQLEPQTVLDFSRNRLRDFFIVQVIELPRTLSVGSYRLKVIATDVVSGEEVEHGIEFDIVADASALRSAQTQGTVPRRNYYDPDR